LSEKIDTGGDIRSGENRDSPGMSSSSFPGKTVLLKFLRGLRDFFRGLLFYNIGQHFSEQKRCSENVFMLGVVGPLIGIPHLFQYYSLRLLPYYVRDFQAWKKRMVKEHDFFDKVSD
jgi:hypothetical protein